MIQVFVVTWVCHQKKTSVHPSFRWDSDRAMTVALTWTDYPECEKIDAEIGPETVEECFLKLQERSCDLYSKKRMMFEKK
jgi:hypothetical protein